MIWAASGVGAPDAGPPPSAAREQAKPCCGYVELYSPSAEFSTRSDWKADVSWALILTFCIAGTARARRIRRRQKPPKAAATTIRTILVVLDMGPLLAWTNDTHGCGGAGENKQRQRKQQVLFEDDNQKSNSKCNGKRRRRFPAGMTTRNAKANWRELDEHR